MSTSAVIWIKTDDGDLKVVFVRSDGYPKSDDGQGIMFAIKSLMDENPDIRAEEICDHFVERITKRTYKDCEADPDVDDKKKTRADLIIAQSTDVLMILDQDADHTYDIWEENGVLMFQFDNWDFTEMPLKDAIGNLK